MGAHGFQIIYPDVILIASNGEEILGWAALSPTSGWKVYSGVVEVSVYVSEKHHGKGIGKALLKKLIELSENKGIWTFTSRYISREQNQH